MGQGSEAPGQAPASLTQRGAPHGMPGANSARRSTAHARGAMPPLPKSRPVLTLHRGATSTEKVYL